MVGLVPHYPPIEVKTFSLFSTFVAVDSLQPTFRWQPFDVKDTIEKIENVTYEVRIWTMTARSAGKQVYIKNNLTEPFHTVSAPLAPGTRYLWSVRAHFYLNGRPRVTEWALAGYLLRNEAVPNASCLRFRTPSPSGRFESSDSEKSD